MTVPLSEYFILDSCIVEYLLDKYISVPLSQQISLWTQNYIKLAISEISYSELIDGAMLNKEKQVISLLDSYYSFPLNKRILKGAGILGSLYQEDSNELRNISLADKLIAMTACVYNLPVITANTRDFPLPFFHSITDENVIYQKNNSSRMINIGVIRANYPYIANKFNNRK